MEIDLFHGNFLDSLLSDPLLWNVLFHYLLTEQNFFSEWGGNWLVNNCVPFTYHWGGGGARVHINKTNKCTLYSTHKHQHYIKMPSVKMETFYFITCCFFFLWMWSKWTYFMGTFWIVSFQTLCFETFYFITCWQNIIFLWMGSKLTC